MSTYRPLGSALYVYDFQHQRRRFCGPTGKTNKREADEVERQERDKARELMKKLATREDSPLTLDLAIDRYWLEAGQHKSNASALLKDLGRLLHFFGKDTLLTDISDPEIAKLVAWRRGHFRNDKKKLGLISPAHVNRSATEVLQRVFTRAIKVWKIPLPNAPDWGQHMLEESEERVRELRQDEDAALRATFDADYEMVRQFSLASGLRQKPSLLKWSQVDFKAEVVIVVGKGNKLQRLPMTPKMREILLTRVGHHDEWVFTYKAARAMKPVNKAAESTRRVRKARYPITVSGLKTHWRRRRAKANVTNYRWHDNRHTFATNLLRTTQNLKLVKRALNHSKLETTDKYAHVMDDELRAGMENAEQNRDGKSREIYRGNKPKAG